MKLKSWVKVKGIKPEIVVAMIVIKSIIEKLGVEFVVTAITDGVHMKGSLHYSGYAIDVRTRDIPKSKLPTLLKEVKSALGLDYDCVLEATHMHVEFDPK